MKLTTFILSLSIFVEIRGYTPTFRNEATHPLKAPTESTLGLQVNDDTAARTKSNEPAAKQEPVFSGGNHFEYMLLNDSNILLTSLQNDGPFDTAAAQFASSKQKQSRKNDHTPLNATTDPTKSIQIEATLPPHNLTAPSTESNTTFRIISKTNFKVEPPVISSRPAISGAGKSAVEFIDAGHQSMDAPKATFDQRSLKTTKFLVNPLSKTEPDDYDDAFTKLLISNGILKPAKSVPYHPMEEYVVHNYSADENLSRKPNNDDSPIGADASVETQIKSRDIEHLSRSNCSTDLDVSLETSTRSRNHENNVESSIQNFNSHPETAKLTPVVSENPTNSVNNKTVTNHNVRKTVDYVSTEISTTRVTYDGEKNFSSRIPDQDPAGNRPDQHTNFASMKKSLKSAEPLHRNVSGVGENNTNSTTTKGIPLVELVTENISTKEHIPLVPNSNLGGVTVLRRKPRTKSKSSTSSPDKSAPQSATGVSANTSSPSTVNNSDNVISKGTVSLPAIVLRNQADEVTDHDSSPSRASHNTDPAPEAASLRKPPSLSMLRESEDTRTTQHKLLDKNVAEDADRQLTIPEFEHFLKSLVQKLFNSVTDYVGKLNKPTNSNREATQTMANSMMHIKRFVLFNVTMVERGWLKRFPSLSTGISCTFPWTNLLDNRTVNVQRHVNDLFDDDSADFFWFGVPLKHTAPYPLLTKETFCDLFETDLAVRVHLEYQGRKIEAVFTLPRALAPNISMSAANLSVDVNAQTAVDSKRSEVVELLESNVTVFKYDSMPYHILELGTSKLIPPKAMAKVWVPQHEDIETFINFILGSLCLFCILSFMLYGVYRFIQIHPPLQSFRNFWGRYRFLERPKAKRKRIRDEAMASIFQHNLHSKYVNSSWLDGVPDNSQHTSCILKPCKEVPERSTTGAHFPSRERAEVSEHIPVETVAIDSPRLNKENRVPMMGHRSYCILLPHTRPYDDDDERCFENPNYRQDIR